MEKGKKIIGIVLILVSIAALFTWEKWGKNRFLYEDVLAFSQNVEKGTVITEDMISTVKMDIGEEAVSYTHLDVYKRQAARWSFHPLPWEELRS